MQEQKMRIGGAVIIPVPCSATNRAALAAALDNYSLGECMPEPTTPKAALRAAMTELYPPPDKETKHITVPHVNGAEGYKVGAHRPDEEVHVNERFVEAVAIGTLDMDSEGLWTGRIDLAPYDFDKTTAVQDYMRHVMEYVPAGALAKCVATAVEKLGGHILVPNKPAYWLNAERLEEFKGLVRLIEQASAETDKHGKSQEPTTIHVLSVVADEQMVRAVTAMITSMVEEEVEAIEEDVARADMTPQKCENRIAKCGKLHKKVRDYEQALAQPLAKLTEQVQRAAIAAATASLQASATGGPVSTF